MYEVLVLYIAMIVFGPHISLWSTKYWVLEGRSGLYNVLDMKAEIVKY